MHRYVKEWLGPFRMDPKQSPPLLKFRSIRQNSGYMYHSADLGCILPLSKAYSSLTIRSHCMIRAGKFISKKRSKSYCLLLVSRTLSKREKPITYFRK